MTGLFGKSTDVGTLWWSEGVYEHVGDLFLSIFWDSFKISEMVFVDWFFESIDRLNEHSFEELFGVLLVLKRS